MDEARARKLFEAYLKAQGPGKTADMLEAGFGEGGVP